MKQPLLLGIDAGTSKVKAALFDLQGHLLQEAAADVRTISPAHDQTEMDLQELWASVAGLIRQLAAGREDGIQAVGLSVTSPTVVLFDEQLQPVRPGIVYLDNRSAQEVAFYTKELGGREGYFARTGNYPSPSTCIAATLNWLKKHEPDNWRRTRKIGFLNSFLAARLTGQLAVDPTVSSYSGLMDVRNPKNWDEGLVDIFGIERQLLPEVIPSHAKVGEISGAFSEVSGLPAGIPVAIGGADSAVAALALNTRSHGDVYQSMGTSEVLTFCLDVPDFSPAFMNRSHVIPGSWLAHGAMSTTGAAIKWILKQVLSEFKDEQELEREAVLSPVGANGLIFLPYLCGERSPMFDAKATGVFFGFSLTTNRADMIRAVYEGAAYGMRQIYTIGTEKWGIRPAIIKCVGGASKSLLAIQLRADALNTALQSIESDSAGAYGAALLGGMAAGVYTEFDELPYMRAMGRTVQPSAANAAHYGKYAQIYDQLYPQLKAVMHIHSEQKNSLI